MRQIIDDAATLPTPVGAGSARPDARVLVVDDHELIGHSLAVALSATGFVPAFVAGPDHYAIRRRAAEFDPDVVVLDLDLGPAGDGRDLIGEMLGLGATVIVLTANTDPETRADCLGQGAAGVLGKTASVDDILGAVRMAAVGAAPMAAADRQEILAAARAAVAERKRRLALFDHLSPREEEVLLELAEGRSPAEIAAASYTAVSTVRGHIKSILAKLGVGSQLAAVAKARRSGWLP